MLGENANTIKLTARWRPRPLKYQKINIYILPSRGFNTGAPLTRASWELEKLKLPPS